jgi:hypothetical protein
MLAVDQETVQLFKQLLELSGCISLLRHGCFAMGLLPILRVKMWLRDEAWALHGHQAEISGISSIPTASPVPACDPTTHTPILTYPDALPVLRLKQLHRTGSACRYEMRINCLASPRAGTGVTGRRQCTGKQCLQNALKVAHHISCPCP